jgi:hypothetical protein
MAVITGLALLVAVGLIIFQVNPQQDTNARNLNSQQRELARQVQDINAIICSQAQTTANAYRFRSLTPSGRVEPIRHFLTRLQAQRQTLRLSRGRECAVPEGFPPFDMQLERALDEINAILAQFTAKQKEPVSQDNEAFNSYPSPSKSIQGFGFPPLVPSSGNHAGVGEEGVPYVPKKPKAPKGSSPFEPEAMPANERQDKATPPKSSAPEKVPAPESPNPPLPAETKPPLDEVVKGTEGAVGGVGEGLCTAIRQVHGLC